MATFTKRGTSWRAQVRKGGLSLSAVFSTKAAAAAWAREKETEIENQRLGKLPAKTFGDVLRRYLDEITPEKRASRTEGLRLAAMLRDDPIAKIAVKDLTPQHFADWRDRRAAVVSPGSVLREMNTISHVCRIAEEEWRWMQGSPMRTVKRPKEPPPRQRRVSADEIERLLLACGYDRDYPPETEQARIGSMILFAIETAMRSGEICAMKWSDINGRVVHIPKTKTDVPRNVPLSTEALRIITQLPRLEDRVFAVEDASRDALFRKARDRSMIEDLHFHDLRREALSRMSKKLDVMELARVSGHKDLKILMSVYYAPKTEELADKLG